MPASLNSLVIAIITLAGCAGAPPKTEVTTDWPLIQQRAAADRISEPEGPLDLSTALTLTVLHHPQLQGAEDLERLRNARIRAAKVAPNPALELTAEDVLGSGPFRGAGGSQWTLTVSQLVELGGKPAARAALAQSQSAAELVQFQLNRLTVLSAVTLDFAQLVFLQERRKNLAHRMENANTLEQAIAARIEAGKESELQLKQYQLQLSLLRFDLEDLDRQVQAARSRLASHWGSQAPRFSHAVGRFSIPEKLPSASELRARLARHPETQLRHAQIAQLQAQRELERRQAVPDIAFSLGVRMISEDRNAAMVGGISLALPVWDRRREAVEVLDAQVRGSAREATAQLFLLGQTLDRKLAELTRQREELLMLDGRILPELEANLRLFREGFAMGRFTLLEMLETQKGLFELRDRILNARMSLQTIILELEFLTGMPLDSGGSR